MGPQMGQKWECQGSKKPIGGTTRNMGCESALADFLQILLFGVVISPVIKLNAYMAALEEALTIVLVR